MYLPRCIVSLSLLFVDSSRGSCPHQCECQHRDLPRWLPLLEALMIADATDSPSSRVTSLCVKCINRALERRPKGSLSLHPHKEGFTARSQTPPDWSIPSLDWFRLLSFVSLCLIFSLARF